MKKISFIFLICILYTFPVYAKRGCCSWHGGVCGCSNGRQLCCDGSLSPSCVCALPSYERRKIDYTPKIIQTASGKVEIHPFDKGKQMRMFLYNLSGSLSGKATVDTEGNGIMISYDTSQNKTEECEIQKFKPFGFCKKYYNNGKIKAEGIIENEKKEGVWNFYNEDGIIESKAEFKKNELNGKSTKFFPSGRIYQEAHWHKGKLDGKAKTYTEAGKLKSVGQYSDNFLDGMQKEYYENGELYQKAEFSNGKENGIFKEYYENGELKVKTEFIQGLRSGKEKYYYPSGKIMYIAKIKENQPLEEIGYYEDGSIKYEVCFTCKENLGYCLTENKKKINLNKNHIDTLKNASTEFDCNE